jgi:hypothetical protein
MSPHQRPAGSPVVTTASGVPLRTSDLIPESAREVVIAWARPAAAIERRALPSARIRIQRRSSSLNPLVSRASTAPIRCRSIASRSVGPNAPPGSYGGSATGPSLVTSRATRTRWRRRSHSSSVTLVGPGTAAP